MPTTEDAKVERELLGAFPWVTKYTDEGRSLTEMEMLHGALDHPNMADHVFFYFRDPNHEPDLPPEPPVAHERQLKLKERIRNSGYPVKENYPDPKSVGEWVREDL